MCDRQNRRGSLSQLATKAVSGTSLLVTYHSNITHLPNVAGTSHLLVFLTTYSYTFHEGVPLTVMSRRTATHPRALCHGSTSQDKKYPSTRFVNNLVASENQTKRGTVQEMYSALHDHSTASFARLSLPMPQTVCDATRDAGRPGEYTPMIEWPFLIRA